MIAMKNNAAYKITDIHNFHDYPLTDGFTEEAFFET